jgi:nitrogen fixation-related uncharacterized protein
MRKTSKRSKHHKTRCLQCEKQEPFSKANHIRFFSRLNKDIGSLHHSFCGEQYDYMLPYYETDNPNYLKVKYTAKILCKISFMSILAGALLISPYILRAKLDLSLIIPCSVFLGFVLFFKFNALTGFLWKAKKNKKKDRDQTENKWRILRPDEVDLLSESVKMSLKEIYTYCGKNKKDWLSFRANLVEIHRKLIRYRTKSMCGISTFDLIYYRMLVLFAPMCKSVLTALVSSCYLYISAVILFTDTHAVPVDSLRNIVDALLFAIFISTVICCFKLLSAPSFVKNFGKQLSCFTELSDKTGDQIKSLNKGHGL